MTDTFADALKALDPLTPEPAKLLPPTEPKPRRRLPYMAYEHQQQITRLCVRCGLLLMQYGAESATVTDLCRRLGIALGLASVECGIAYNGLTITTIYNNRCITTLRASTTHAINVNIIVQIQRIVLDLESMPVTSTLEHATYRFDEIDRDTYPAKMVAPMVGVACACFAYLAGGDILVCLVTFIASMMGYSLRLWLSNRNFNPFISALIAACFGSIFASTALLLGIGNDPHIAMASSVLWLVPSFPLINSLSDMFKGYMNIGIGRFMFVIILTLSSCIGIVLSLLLLNISHWGVG